MARGFLNGVIGGIAVAGIGLGGLSLFTEIPGAEPPEPSTDISTPPETPTEDSAPAQAAKETPSQQQTDEEDDNTLQAQQTEAPQTDVSSGVDSASAGKPEAGSGDVSVLKSPEDGEGSASDAGTAQSDTPMVSKAPAEAPNVPESDAEASVETRSALPQPEPEEPEDPVARETAEDEPPSQAQEEPESMPEPLPDEEREEITLFVPETPSENDGQNERVNIGTPATQLESSQSKRLPALGNSTQEAAAENDAPAQESVEDLPPIERFAAPFEPESDAPKMAIVLIDDGSSDIGVEALSTFPYPLSFAVDTSWEGAGDAMAMYRAQGFEVLAMIDLPEGAQASDVEVSMPVLLEKVPEAVGVMETPDSGLQTSREVAAQVSEYTRDSGHGLLFFPKGLNTAQKLAAKEGVPSASVFRDFDGQGQNASAVKRFLSHGALKADSEEGGVVMVGRLRADTISALLLWGLQERGGRVELAPVSQLLTTADPQG